MCVCVRGVCIYIYISYRSLCAYNTTHRYISWPQPGQARGPQAEGWGASGDGGRAGCGSEPRNFENRCFRLGATKNAGFTSWIYIMDLYGCIGNCEGKACGFVG